ncbi:MAG: paraquat-inducible protein A [Gammaproteobacteria bacterium]
MLQPVQTPVTRGELVACHECDTLLRLPPLAPGRSLRCSRCGALLLRNPKGGLDRPIALNIAALVLLVLANAFPFLTLQISGREQTTTIIGASRALYEAGMGPLAVVVLITTLIGPALVVISSLYVLLGVRMRMPLPMLREMLAWISHVQPWGMLDVFMLGVLVSSVKLAGMADMVLGPALYAFAGLILVSAAATSALEPHVLWQRLDPLGEPPHAR